VREQAETHGKFHCHRKKRTEKNGKSERVEMRGEI
jgi:hypothetical protein